MEYMLTSMLCRSNVYKIPCTKLFTKYRTLKSGRQKAYYLNSFEQLWKILLIKNILKNEFGVMFY